MLLIPFPQGKCVWVYPEKQTWGKTQQRLEEKSSAGGCGSGGELLTTQLGFQPEGGLAFLEPAAFLWKEKRIYWFSYLQQIEFGFEELL